MSPDNPSRCARQTKQCGLRTTDRPILSSITNQMDDIAENKVKIKAIEDDIKSTTDINMKVALINLLTSLQQKENNLMLRAPQVVDTSPPSFSESVKNVFRLVKLNIMNICWADNGDTNPWGSLLRWVTTKRTLSDVVCSNQDDNSAFVVISDEHRSRGSSSFQPGPSNVDHRRPS